jgi:hypothetical protein
MDGVKTLVVQHPRTHWRMGSGTIAQPTTEQERSVSAPAGTAAGGQPAVWADAGYCSETNVEAVEERGIDGCVATGRMSRSSRCPPAPRRRIPRGLTRRERMKRRLMTKPGRAT